MTTLFFQPMGSDFETLFRQIDEIFEGATRPATASKVLNRPTPQTTTAPAWKPRAAVREWGDRYELQFQLPGIDPAALDIEARRDLIVLKGERKAPEGTQAIHSEFRYGTFERRFRLAEEIQPEAVSAHYEQGILTLVLPKLAAAEDYSIKVAIHGVNPDNPLAENAAEKVTEKAVEPAIATDAEANPDKTDETTEPEPVW